MQLFLSGHQTNCVTTRRTGIKRAAKPWNRRGRFFALWQDNLPAYNKAKYVIFKVFKGKIFSGGKAIRILQEMLSAALRSQGRNSTI